MPTRRELIQRAALAALSAAAPASEAEVPTLYRVADPAAIIAAARAFILKDTIATLITVDPDGQPRARSILASPMDDEHNLYFGTRLGSRKLTQIAANPHATVHFAEDTGGNHVSLMGKARVITDPAIIEAKSPYHGDLRRQYFPNYPADFALIAFHPDYLEIMSADFPGTKTTWQPQGVALS